MTQWGTQNEGNAFGAYQNVTGHGVEKLGIGIMGSHAAESWIGASPDGLITTRPQSNRKPHFQKTFNTFYFLRPKTASLKSNAHTVQVQILQNLMKPCDRIICHR